VDDRPALVAPGVVRLPQRRPDSPGDRIRRAYQRQKARAGGTWYSYVGRVDGAGVPRPVVEDDVDHVVHGYSVQKLAVAAAVLDKVDRGRLTLDRKVTLTGDIVLPGSGIYAPQTVYGDHLTIANVLTAMLLVSDNTAVRLCGLVCPAAEINDILAAKGFAHTRVEPVADPNRFFLGTTTPREIQDLLVRLAGGTLLAPSSATFMLGVLRWVSGYMDGIRRTMSSAERARIGTKCGADVNTLGAARHEAGIMFGAGGSPALVYGFFAEGLAEPDNYGATHPAVQAHAVLGRTLFDAIGDAG
jgi:beta-lactamase class A